MVSLDVVQSSNSSLSSSLPSNLVAVFVGGSSGIGEVTLLHLVKVAKAPRIYIVARSAGPVERVIAKCRTINPDGDYIFMQKGLDLMKSVDELCGEIERREKAINLLFLSAGEPDISREKTSEGLHRIVALNSYGRILINQKLLPLLQTAATTSSLARVVSVSGGNLVGPIDTTDLPGFNVPLTKLRGHFASLGTLANEQQAKYAPDVSFLYTYPGLVVTPSQDKMKGIIGVIARTVIWLFGRWIAVQLEESGERHLFMSTSEAFKPKDGKAIGVPLVDGLDVQRGSDGEEGSGFYSLGADQQGVPASALTLLDGYRKDGTAKTIWEHNVSEIERVLGKKVF